MGAESQNSHGRFFPNLIPFFRYGDLMQLGRARSALHDNDGRRSRGSAPGIPRHESCHAARPGYPTGFPTGRPRRKWLYRLPESSQFPIRSIRAGLAIMSLPLALNVNMLQYAAVA